MTPHAEGMTAWTLAGPAQSQWHRWSTQMHLLVADAGALPTARALVDAELDAIELAASRFRPDSEVSMLAAHAGAPMPISPLLAALIEAALDAARFTDGDVDPTVGSALIALGYDRDINELGGPRVTSIARPANWAMVDFDGRSVRLPTGVLLDLGATAKALAADRCAQLVFAHTGSGVLVNLGGDIATAGPVPEDGWQVLVTDTDDDPVAQVSLGTDTGLATSSTQRRRWWRDGDLVHHIVDPRTGRSADPVWRTVSVVAGTCVAANTISTAAVIRGHRAPEWIASLEVPARLVDSDGEVRTVGGWPK